MWWITGFSRFESVEAVEKIATHVRKELTEHCFEQWKTCMEHCKDKGSVYIAGDIK